MKKNLNYLFIGITLIVFLSIAIIACKKEKSLSNSRTVIDFTQMDSLRSVLLYKKLPRKEFDATLNSLQQLMSDSLIASKKKIEGNILRSSTFVTTLRICSMYALMSNSGNGILLQTQTDINGVIHAAAYGISGEHGQITQIGSIEQKPPSQGVTCFQIYYQGTFSTSSAYTGSGGATLGMPGVASLNASAGYSSTSGGFKSDMYVVYGNIQDGCPVALGAMPYPPVE